MIETPDQELRAKASIRFIEKTAKHPDGWNFVEDCSLRGNKKTLTGLGLTILP
jgi:hypothetical protein